MKKIAFLAVCLSIFVAAASCAAFAAERRLECVPTAGKIMFMDSGKTDWAEMAATFEVRTGSKLKSPDRCEAAIRYSDGTTLIMRQNSEMEIKPDGIRLNEGGVWVKLIKSKSGFRVDTPNVTIGARGTIFSVFKNVNKTVVKLTEGIVDVINKMAGDKVTTLKPGDRIAFDPKGMTVEVNDKEIDDLFGPNPFDRFFRDRSSGDKGEKIDKQSASTVEVESGNDGAKGDVKIKNDAGVGTGNEKNLKEFMGR